MKKLIDLIAEDVKEAFLASGYEEKFGMVSLSNRPDLCQYQCNGAMAAAKQYKVAPIEIAKAVAEKLADSDTIAEVNAVMPGFINIKVDNEFLAAYLQEMAEQEYYGFEKAKNPLTIIVDYGGPNVAKELHVGHLRPAVIGESIKRICRFVGDKVIADVHLGDWGKPMGLLIAELQERNPNLPYFDADFTGEYPKEAPFTGKDLATLYPQANQHAKDDEGFAERAHECTRLLQDGHRGYRALWQHFIDMSVADIKELYDELDISFDLWRGESHVHDRLQKMPPEPPSETLLQPGK